MLPPLSIDHRLARGSVDILWQDGFQSELPGSFLRSRCRCAECVAIRRAGGEVAASDLTKVVGIVPVGTGAVQLLFSDGHARGIFPWAWLRQLADEAMAAVGSRAGYNGDVTPQQTSHGHPH
jgi:DUF971 family protein